MNTAMTQFKNKTPDFNKLISYGFVKSGEIYEYITDICSGQFKMTVRVQGGSYSARLYDSATGDEYTLHRVEGAGGEFVGRVRAEYDGVLDDIAKNCFITQIFTSRGALRAIDFAKREYGDGLEFLWRDLDAAVLRRKDTQKWYALIMKIPRRRLFKTGEGDVEILNVRCDPEKIGGLLDGETLFPAYHMNKKHWISVVLESLSDGDTEKFMVYSYENAK